MCAFPLLWAFSFFILAAVPEYLNSGRVIPWTQCDGEVLLIERDDIKLCLHMMMGGVSLPPPPTLSAEVVV